MFKPDLEKETYSITTPWALYDRECKGRAWTMTLCSSWYRRIMRARNVPFGNRLLPHPFHFYLGLSPSDTIALRGANHKTIRPSSDKIFQTFPRFLRQIRDYSVFSDFHLMGCGIIGRFIISYGLPPTSKQGREMGKF